MRVVFLGTPEFAVPSLRALLESRYEVAAVFTQPDRPSGRGNKVVAPPVRLLAATRAIPVFQPVKIRSEDSRPIFEQLAPDFLVVVAYGQILPRWLLDSARVAAVNVHASLLPAYRGAAPVNWAVLNGETKTGVTTMLMEEKLDSGPLLLTTEVPIPSEMTSGELSEVLAGEGARLLVPTLDGLAAGSLGPLPQDESRVSWAPKLTKEMGKIDWARAAAEIHNRIRGLNPWPLAYTAYEGEHLQIRRSASPTEGGSRDFEPGTLLGLTREGILIQCGQETALEVLEVQPPNRGRMSGREFAAGARLKRHEAAFPPEPLPRESR